MERDPDEHVHPGQEDLKWGLGIKDKERRKGNAPTAKYSKFSEQARRLIAGETQCAMFCGGKNCKYCTSDNWKPEQMAIKGLYSEWVTDNILAMARPSNYAFDKLGVLDQFIENKIKTVINLQQPGEHASCGHGNDASGFSYNPQRLMEKDIFFYNFAWQDYGIAPMSTLLDIVKVMQFAVYMGKVAVHCHAGLGRTGLLIACYLVYNNRVLAGEAVHYVRSRRPGAIQTSQQVQTVLDFETHLKPFRTVFPSKLPGESEVSFKHFLNRQSHMIHGFEARRLKHIPKVVYICCERLLELAGRGQALSKIHDDMPDPKEFTPVKSHLSRARTVDAGLAEPQKSPSFSELIAARRNRVSIQRNSVTLEDLSDVKFKKVLMENRVDEDTTSGDLSVLDDGFVDGQSKDQNGDTQHSEEEDDDDCIVFGKPDVVVLKKETETSENNADSALSVLSGNEDSSLPSSADCQQVSEKHCAHGTPGNGTLDSVNGNDLNANSSRKRRVKKKGLGERFKGRSKKGSRKTLVDGGIQTGETGEGRDATDRQERSAESGQHTERSVGSEHSSGKSLGSEYSCGKSTGSGNSSGTNVDLGHSAEAGGKPDSELHVLTNSSVPGEAPDPEGKLNHVCEAMAATEYSASVRQRADDLEMQLNETDAAWTSLSAEKDPSVLSAVLWDWLDQLKEPVLRRQDLTVLLERSENPRDCLHHLEKNEDLRIRLAERLLSHLTHHSVKYQCHLSSFSHNPHQHSHWGEMRNNEADHLIEFFFKLVDQILAAHHAS